MKHSPQLIPLENKCLEIAAQSFVMSTALWALAIFMGARALFQISSWFVIHANRLLAKHEFRILSQVQDLLEIQVEMLKVGQVPDPPSWNRIFKLGDPWGVCIEKAMLLIRENGARAVPALKRFRDLARYRKDVLGHVAAKTSMARMQAFVSLMLVPAVSVFLAVLIPSVQAQIYQWIGLSALAFLGGIFAFFWIDRLAQRASFGAFTSATQNQPEYVMICTEYLMATIESGVAPDRAWSMMIELLAEFDLSLAADWGASVWTEAEGFEGSQSKGGDIQSYGSGLRQSIYRAVMQGTGVLEALNDRLREFQTQTRNEIDKRMESLPIQTLKPIFIVLFPSQMLLIVYSIYLIYVENFEKIGITETAIYSTY